MAVRLNAIEINKYFLEKYLLGSSFIWEEWSAKRIELFIKQSSAKFHYATMVLTKIRLDIKTQPVKNTYTYCVNNTVSITI